MCGDFIIGGCRGSVKEILKAPAFLLLMALVSAIAINLTGCSSSPGPKPPAPVQCPRTYDHDFLFLQHPLFPAG